MVDSVDIPRQVVLATVADNELQPDAMRGSETFLRNIKDADGNLITVEDAELKRREMQAKMQPHLAEQPNIVPGAEQSPTDPTLERATVPLTPDAPTTSPTNQTFSWQDMARLAGWEPPASPNTLPPEVRQEPLPDMPETSTDTSSDITTPSSDVVTP